MVKHHQIILHPSGKILKYQSIQKIFNNSVFQQVKQMIENAPLKASVMFMNREDYEDILKFSKE